MKELASPKKDRFQREDPVDTTVLTTGVDPIIKRKTIALEFSALLTGSDAELEEAAQAFNQAAQEFYEKCQEKGVAVQRSRGYMRQLTKEENIMITPRKHHFERNGSHICDTSHVAKKYLTTDKSKVTCKICLRFLEQEEKENG